MSPSDGDRPLPLDGIVVLDLGQIYQGPYAGFLLAMAGARVIKVEQRKGEPLRGRGRSLPFAMLNSSKEAVTVDLKAPEGVALLKRLVASADVVLVNYAPGVPERLGISFGDLVTHNPKLVYAHASGFGLDSESSVPAMDVTVQAHTGAMSVTGFPDSDPVKAGVAYVDFLGGTHLYGAITTALFEVARTGHGAVGGDLDGRGRLHAAHHQPRWVVRTGRDPEARATSTPRSGWCPMTSTGAQTVTSRSSP